MASPGSTKAPHCPPSSKLASLSRAFAISATGSAWRARSLESGRSSGGRSTSASRASAAAVCEGGDPALQVAEALVRLLVPSVVEVVGGPDGGHRLDDVPDTHHPANGLPVVTEASGREPRPDGRAERHRLRRLGQVDRTAQDV